MSSISFERVTPGQTRPPRAADYNRRAEATENILKSMPINGMVHPAGGIGQRPAVVPITWIIAAKLTSRSGTDDRIYAWTEAIPNAAGWEVLTPGGATGEFDKTPALDITDPDIRVDVTNAFVPLGRGRYRDAGGTVKPCWYVLGYRLPKAEHQWMSMTMVSANQWGAEMDRIHGLVPNEE